MAQSGSYDDDIYSNGSDLRNDKSDDRRPAQTQQRYQTEQYYSSSGQDYNQNQSEDNGDYRNYSNSYESDGDGYNNYDNDYAYATSLRRFNSPFYNMGYWSAFQNPYWYDPFWTDPYWGWSPWNRPGISIGFGGGPYWSSYSSWYNWYGYNGFNSFYGYPYYAGGWGSGMWCGVGSYYGNYWNGYYAGVYGGGYGIGYGNYRSVTYGPRYNLNGSTANIQRASSVGRNGMRIATPTASNGGSSTYNPRQRMRVGDPGAGATPGVSNAPVTRDGGAVRTRGQFGQASPVDGSIRTPVRDNGYNNQAPVSNDRGVQTEQPRRGFFQREPVNQNNGAQQQPVRQRTWGGSRSNGGNENFSAPQRSIQQENTIRQERTYERQQPTYSQPRMESSPRMSSPSFDRGGFGGGSVAPSGGGGGGIRRR